MITKPFTYADLVARVRDDWIAAVSDGAVRSLRQLTRVKPDA